MINSIRKIFSILLFVFAALVSKSQIITVNTNLQIPCCVFSDSIDIENDGIFDFTIESNFYGTFAGFMARVPNNSIISINQPSFGLNFGFENHQSSNVASQIIDHWSWTPSSNKRYIGFAKINSPLDTTFAWVELDFRGEDFSISDTVFILSYGYNTISNERIFAGQTSPLQISLNEKSNYFTVYPNPSKNYILIETENINSDFEIILSDITGKIILRKENCSSVDVSDFANGIYFITIPELNHTEKIQILK